MSSSASIERWTTSYVLALTTEGRSERTITNHQATLELFAAWLTKTDRRHAIDEIGRDIIRAYLIDLDQTRHNAPGTIKARYQHLRSFFGWLIAEGALHRNPMDNVKVATPGDKPVAILTNPQIHDLLAVCGGRRFEDRRDTAIVLVLFDTGVRRAELLIGMAVEGLDLMGRGIDVVGKGNKTRRINFGARAARALDAYLHMRDDHRYHTHPALWLGRAGPLGPSGLRTMLDRRARKAGIGHVFPHQFRHTFSHNWLLAGGEETDLMTLNGWTSRQMLERYGASGRAERAAAAHRRLSPADHLS